MLKVWNVLLVILAFSLSLFGTFLTRSGVVNSIHSFTQSSIGPWFLAFIAVVVAVSLGLVFWRLPQLRSPTKLESPISREAAFLYNNLLLLALCLAIFWGVVYPMVSEALRGEAVVLGRSYYDFFLRAFGLPLLLLMGIGPLIAWRRASLRSLATTFRWPTGVALAHGRRAPACSGPEARCRVSSRTRSRPSSWRRSSWSSRAERGRARRSARRPGPRRSAR